MASAKSGSSSSVVSDARPPDRRGPSWPPRSSARRVKTSMWRASSAAWIASSCSTSRKCGWMRPRNRAGTTSAACSFSTRYVITWTTARLDLGGEVERGVPGDGGGRDPTAPPRPGRTAAGRRRPRPGRGRRGRTRPAGPPASTSAPRAARPHVAGGLRARSRPGRARRRARRRPSAARRPGRGPPGPVAVGRRRSRGRCRAAPGRAGARRSAGSAPATPQPLARPAAPAARGSTSRCAAVVEAEVRRGRDAAAVTVGTPRRSQRRRRRRSRTRRRRRRAARSPSSRPGRHACQPLEVEQRPHLGSAYDIASSSVAKRSAGSARTSPSDGHVAVVVRPRSAPARASRRRRACPRGRTAGGCRRSCRRRRPSPATSARAASRSPPTWSPCWPTPTSKRRTVATSGPAQRRAGEPAGSASPAASRPRRRRPCRPADRPTTRSAASARTTTTEVRSRSVSRIASAVDRDAARRGQPLARAARPAASSRRRRSGPATQVLDLALVVRVEHVVEGQAVLAEPRAEARPRSVTTLGS